MSRLSHLLVAALMLSAFSTFADAAPKRRAAAPASGGEESSLVGLHELRKEGGKTCMSTHSHNGYSTNQPTKKAAEVEALRQWAAFTGWEYGRAWGNPMLGADRTMKCNGSAGAYNCDFEARPCRR